MNHEGIAYFGTAILGLRAVCKRLGVPSRHFDDAYHNKQSFRQGGLNFSYWVWPRALTLPVSRFTTREFWVLIDHDGKVVASDFLSKLNAHFKNNYATQRVSAVSAEQAKQLLQNELSLILG